MGSVVGQKTPKSKVRVGRSVIISWNTHATVYSRVRKPSQLIVHFLRYTSVEMFEQAQNLSDFIED